MSQHQQPVLWLLNAFSLNMLGGHENCQLEVSRLREEAARALAASARSGVGHADTAALFSTTLGREVACVRATVQLANGDRALVGQYLGPRLEVGAATLPEGARIEWFLVSVVG
jgi:hypothetical protein